MENSISVEHVIILTQIFEGNQIIENGCFRYSHIVNAIMEMMMMMAAFA